MRMNDLLYTILFLPCFTISGILTFDIVSSISNVQNNLMYYLYYYLLFTIFIIAMFYYTYHVYRVIVVRSKYSNNLFIELLMIKFIPYFVYILILFIIKNVI